MLEDQSKSFLDNLAKGLAFTDHMVYTEGSEVSQLTEELVSQGIPQQSCKRL